jgi:membrane associated rhomboid family serine protease
MSNYYRPGGVGFSFFPPVIKNLLIINAAVFFLMYFLGDQGRYTVERWLALMPLGMGFYVWQLITYQFLHAGFFHIFFNMFMLWMFGMEIEQEWGSKKFLLYYLTAGVGAGLLHMLMTPVLGQPPAPTVGASGSIYGVLLAFALMFPDRPIYLWFLIPIKAKYLIGFFMILEILAIDSAHSNVAHLAHIGGALVGFLWIMLDSSIRIPLKNAFKNSSSRGSSSSSKKRSDSFFGSAGSPSSRRTTPQRPKRKTEVEDAEFYEITDDEEIAQEEIDRILDKIGQSGYKNLTDREKRILFEASKRMK